MRGSRKILFATAIGLCAVALLSAAGGASSYPANSPEGRLDATRAELIALRGTLVTPAARLWLSRSVASLGWAIGAECWAADGATLDTVTGGRCLNAIRVAVNRLAMGDQVDRVSAELRGRAYPQILELVQIVREIAIGSLNAASADPQPPTDERKLLLWKAQHDIYALGDNDTFDPRWALGDYLRSWHRLNGPADPPPSIVLGGEGMQPKLDYNPAGLAEAFEVTASGSGLNRISLYVDPASTATSLVAGIYADGEGGPGQLLAQSATPLAEGGGDWNSVHLPRIALTPGVKYWVAILTPDGGGTLRFRDRCCRGAGTTFSVVSNDTHLMTLPDTWSSGRQFKDGPLSVFGTN
jgi:hypothetical protein